ncbi:hypothetical protein ASG88_06020 [Nocardioides sp. Soil777]|uniref:sulfatase family protein n=1 Tax=Nocardioides sp. Soil777 TaxID=1736409 RepID=UPI00070335E8|nr:sulfatase [Nocardioides sp. Soil777]KRF02914.1 hypothetical protein ASG88_06020 [Nocardioides sp. Soil777]
MRPTHHLVLMTAALVLATTGTLATVELASSQRADPRPPNIVLITSDDQTAVELRWMPRTRRLLGRAGVSFSDMVAPHPNCCPSRAQILSGQYAHNNGVRTNGPPWGGHQRFDPSTALPVWLQRAGYETGFVGKYLHGYDESDGIEPGWDRWRPIIGVLSDYHSFLQYADGELVRFGPEDYHTDEVARQSRELVRDLGAGDRPFFLWSSFLAPHGTCQGNPQPDCSGPPPAADRHADILGDVRLPALDSPSFNKRGPWAKARGTSAPARSRTDAQRLFTQRVRALAALDEAVAGIVEELDRTGELENTVLMFTSDNGYLFGEHRLVGKNVPYEEAVRVPLLMRGPGIPAGQRRTQTVATIDLAPTIAELAGARPMRRTDGTSLLPYAVADRPQPDRALLLQAGSKGTVKARAWTFRGVRTDRYTLVRWKKPRLRELYDRRRDPYQLTNVHADPRYQRIRRQLTRLLRDRLEDCRGNGCRRPVPELPRPGRR